MKIVTFSQYFWSKEERHFNFVFKNCKRIIVIRFFKPLWVIKGVSKDQTSKQPPTKTVFPKKFRYIKSLKPNRSSKAIFLLIGYLNVFLCKVESRLNFHFEKCKRILAKWFYKPSWLIRGVGKDQKSKQPPTKTVFPTKFRYIKSLKSNRSSKGIFHAYWLFERILMQSWESSQFWFFKL